jgi:hypothetical protein
VVAYHAGEKFGLEAYMAEIQVIESKVVLRDLTLDDKDERV